VIKKEFGCYYTESRVTDKYLDLKLDMFPEKNITLPLLWYNNGLFAVLSRKQLSMAVETLRDTEKNHNLNSVDTGYRLFWDDFSPIDQTLAFVLFTKESDKH